MTRTEILAVAKPILFNTEMVKAILDGRKTVTRRCVKPKSKNAYGFFVAERVSDGDFIGVYDYDEEENAFDNPQKQPARTGDILYVRETWCEYDADHVIDVRYAYKADATPISEEARNELGYKWKPSIHMPKEAARIFLRVTGVRVERLRDITVEQALKEGCVNPVRFDELWNATVKKSDLERYGWEANPWVWVIEFERMDYVENPLYVPAADVAPVKHGKWIEYQIPHYFKCSECKCTVPYVKAVLIDGKRKYNYCPACGAKMDEVTK